MIRCKITRTEHVPATETTRVVGMKCDVCGETTNSREHWPNAEHSDTSYGGTKVEVSASDESCYPEGGEKSAEKWDLCPRCFDSLIRKPLIALGAQPRKVEVSW